ncbi:CAP domain-containing protein [uncultured Psychrobacter sp.]|uniref:CAP domain-containing protein n=1 Tax=uncultured Psychrobacter sp. TaxID=259303 RepID=UPI002636795B|nr:CAP domain-containing protein [uncultured Psychrobacter sp.]
MNFITSKKSLVMALSSALLLTACGGGSDSGSSSNKSTDKDSNSSPNTSNTPETVNPTVPNDTSTTSKPTTSQSSEPTTSPEPSDTVATSPVLKSEVDMKDVESKSHKGAAQVGSNLLNTQRQACGLGGVADNDELNKIATQHAQYIQHVFSNSRPTIFNAHGEEEISDIKNWTGKNNPFFTGVSFKDRLLKAGYSNLAYGVVENISRVTYYSSAGKVASPDYAAHSMTKSLLAAPYHMRLLVMPNLSQTGSGMIAYKPYGKAADKSQSYVFVNASSADQKTEKRTVKGLFTYPCTDVVDTNTALYNEFPSPVAGTGRNLGTDPIGQPIYINMPSAKSIKISNIKFRDVKRNINVPVDLLDYSNDPHKRTAYELPKNEAFILPLTDSLQSCETGRRKGKNCGLYGNSEYQVSFDVLVDNKTQESKQITFTTGEVNY